MARFLIVDRSPALAEALTGLIRRFGDEVAHRPALPEAAALEAIDAIALDAEAGTPDAVAAWLAQAKTRKVPVVLLSPALDVGGLAQWYAQGVAYVAIKPVHLREVHAWLYALLRRQRRVVCLGGGTGLYTLLLGLKTLPAVHLTSIVSMSDDGGSTGRIRQAFGILPPGDVRRSLVALSTAPELVNRLMQHRFMAGEGLKDHNLGNLLLAAMAEITGSMAEAVRAMGDLLNIQGVVLPVTTTPNTLVAELADGTVLRGESRIDVPEGRDPSVRITKLWHEPAATANPNALSAILAADVITIGPGDLFTSIIATLGVHGLGEALQAARGRVLYVCNLMTKPGETTGFTVADHVREVLRPVGSDILDAILMSNTRVAPDHVGHYARSGQHLVTLDAPRALQQVTGAQVLLRDVTSDESLVRHHSVKLAQEIGRLFTLSPAAL